MNGLKALAALEHSYRQTL